MKSEIFLLALLAPSVAMGQTVNVEISPVGWCWHDSLWPARADGSCHEEDKNRSTAATTAAPISAPSIGSWSSVNMTIPSCEDGYELVMRGDHTYACARDFKEPTR